MYAAKTCPYTTIVQLFPDTWEFPNPFKHCSYCLFFPDPYQQHDPRNPCKNTDKLGSRQNSHTSTDNIPTEKLDHKPSNAIKDQITGSNLTIFFFVPCDQQQQKKMQKIQSAGIQLRRDQRHVIGRIFGILKYHRKNTLCLFSITAARQEHPIRPNPWASATDGRITSAYLKNTSFLILQYRSPVNIPPMIPPNTTKPELKVSIINPGS